MVDKAESFFNSKRLIRSSHKKWGRDILVAPGVGFEPPLNGDLSRKLPSFFGLRVKFNPQTLNM
jgi:hypothetical protein